MGRHDLQCTINLTANITRVRNVSAPEGVSVVVHAPCFNLSLLIASHTNSCVVVRYGYLPKLHQITTCYVLGIMRMRILYALQSFPSFII